MHPGEAQPGTNPRQDMKIIIRKECIDTSDFVGITSVHDMGLVYFTARMAGVDINLPVIFEEALVAELFYETVIDFEESDVSVLDFDAMLPHAAAHLPSVILQRIKNGPDACECSVTNHNFKRDDK